MNQPLVIIDMQSCYINRDFEAYSNAIDNVAEAIEQAKLRNDYIVFVEYDRDLASKFTFKKLSSKEVIGFNPSLQELRDLTEAYENTIYVYKKHNDGGEEIIKSLIDNDIPFDSIQICGVYTNACVTETVQTLSLKLRNCQINVLKKATASYAGCPQWQELSINYMGSMSNVSIS